jgi:hypothetical protein
MYLVVAGSRHVYYLRVVMCGEAAHAVPARKQGKSGQRESVGMLACTLLVPKMVPPVWRMPSILSEVNTMGL